VTTPARDLVAAAFSDALGRAARQYGWQGWESEPVKAEIPAHAEHGDYATGIAMRLARTLRKPPREIAAAIKEQLDLRPPLASAEVAGGGFVNVRLDVAWLRGQIDAIIREQQPIRERAQRYLDDPSLVRNIVADGCERARKLAEETMRDVREAMGLRYD